MGEKRLSRDKVKKNIVCKETTEKNRVAGKGKGRRKGENRKLFRYERLR